VGSKLGSKLGLNKVSLTGCWRRNQPLLVVPCIQVLGVPARISLNFEMRLDYLSSATINLVITE